jgi:hypothetical protein
MLDEPPLTVRRSGLSGFMAGFQIVFPASCGASGLDDAITATTG